MFFNTAPSVPGVRNIITLPAISTTSNCRPRSTVARSSEMPLQVGALKRALSNSLVSRSMPTTSMPRRDSSIPCGPCRSPRPAPNQARKPGRSRLRHARSAPAADLARKACRNRHPATPPRASQGFIGSDGSDGMGLLLAATSSSSACWRRRRLPVLPMRPGAQGRRAQLRVQHSTM